MADSKQKITTSKKAPEKTSVLTWIRYSFEFIVFINFTLILFIIPWSIVWRIGRGIGAVMAKYFPTRRKLVESNLSLAFPHWEKSKRDNVIRDVYKHWGEMFFATLKLWFLSDRKIESIVEAEDGFKDYLIEKKKQNIPVIFFTGHFGSWEIAGRWVAMMSKGSASIYRIQKNPLVNAPLEWMRIRKGLYLINSWAGLGAISNTLVEKGQLAVVGDQHRGKNSLKISFFGLPSSSPRGAVELIKRVNPELVFLSVNQNLGTYTIHWEKVDYTLPTEPSEEWDIELTQKLMNLLEVEIIKKPEQYFWFHKRWPKLLNK